MDDSDSEADAMAQAMGFSSFGTQSNKRRKYNPRMDEAVTASVGGTLPIHQAVSGSNTTPLGVRTSVDKDEITLDDELADKDAAGMREEEEPDEGGDGFDPEPQYIDTSRPSMPVSTAGQDSDEVQAKINAILGAAATEPDSLAQSIPPSQAAGQGSRGGYGGRGGRQSGRSGQREGQSWWEDYYDPTANMNPWERLEKERGMRPTDSWLQWEESKAKWEEVKTKIPIEGTST